MHDFTETISMLWQVLTAVIGAALTFFGACSVIVAPLKKYALQPFLDRYVDAEDHPQWLRAIDAVARFLDWCAVNTNKAKDLRTLQLGKETEAAAEKAEADSLRPPPGSPGWQEKGHPFAVLALICVVGWPLLGSGCTGALELETRSALNALAGPVDAASLASRTVCDSAGDALVAAKHAGALTLAQAEPRLLATHAQCDTQREVYDGVRERHEAAVAALESGAVERAAALLAELLAQWARLRGGST